MSDPMSIIQQILGMSTADGQAPQKSPRPTAPQKQPQPAPGFNVQERINRLTGGGGQQPAQTDPMEDLAYQILGIDPGTFANGEPTMPEFTQYTPGAENFRAQITGIRNPFVENNSRWGYPMYRRSDGQLTTDQWRRAPESNAAYQKNLNTFNQERDAYDKYQGNVGKYGDFDQLSGMLDPHVQDFNDEAAKRGHDPSGLMNHFVREAQNRVGGAPVGSATGHALTGIGDAVWSGLDQDAVSDAQRLFDQYFNPGKIDSMSSGINFDQMINDELNSRFADAYSYIDNARLRGTLQGTGLASAESNLAKQRAAAESSMSQIGNDLRNSYTTQLQDIIGNERNTLGNFQYGDTFNSGEVDQRLSDRLAQFGQQTKGDFQNRVLGQQFFDPQAAVGAGAISGGTSNAANDGNQTLGAVASSGSNVRGDKKTGRGLQNNSRTF